jgi:RNA recognition motif-containing protein
MAPFKIYVGNLPPGARSGDLRDLFEKFGPVLECDILKDFGFVHMDFSNDAKAAIAALNDTFWKVYTNRRKRNRSIGYRNSYKSTHLFCINNKLLV